MEETKKFTLIDTSFIIALSTGTLYFCTIGFQIGVFRYYKIPFYLLDISVNVLGNGITLMGPLFILFMMFYGVAAIWGNSVRGNRTINLGIGTTAVGVISLTTFFITNQFDVAFLTLLLIIGIILIFVSTALSIRKGKKGEYLKRIIAISVPNELVKSIIIFLNVFFIFIFCVTIGYSKSRDKQEYYIISSKRTRQWLGKTRTS